ncbi:MAG: hypothetical protein ACI9KE_004880 [Polyangiales bacterium]|jgi:hypothetical protein
MRRIAPILTVVMTGVMLVVLCTPMVASAATIEERFQEANGHYYKKRYTQARAIYEDLLGRYQITDPVLQYNLGNTYYHSDKFGRAILAYKRALQLDPSEGLERKIRDNVERCVEALMDRHRKDVSRSVTVLDETHGVVYSLFHLMTVTQIAVAFGLFWLAFFGVLIARRFVSSREHRRGLRNAAISLAVPLVLAGILFAGNRITSETVIRGVILDSNVQMRDGRHPEAPASDVPEGLEVRLIDTTDPTETHIRLSNGKEGWIPAASVEAI